MSTKISMKNGTEKELKDLTQADLVNIKLDTKGDASWLTLKSTIISQDDSHIVERRIYKWKVMEKVVMYDVKYGADLKTLARELTDKVVYNHAIRNFTIEQDKLHNGVTSGKPLDEKLIALASKAGVDEKGLAELKATLKRAGFGK